MTDRNALNPLRRVVLALAVAAGAAGVIGLTHSTAQTASAAPVGSAAPTAVAPAATPAPRGDDAGLSYDELQGMTKPSEESDLAFAGPGVVAKVLVKAGDSVKAGDVVAMQDDSVEKAQLAVAQAEAKTADIQIKANNAQLDLKRVILERAKALYAELLKSGKSNTEVDQAVADVKIAEIQIDYTKQEKDQKELAAALQQVKVVQKKLISPVDGIVATLDVHPGDGTDLTKPAMKIVKNDPLWVEVEIPSTKAKVLSVNQPLEVRYRDEDKWMQGKIIFLTPYANAGSDTRTVRLEMPNPKHREAGVPVVVKLPENVAAAK